MTALTPLPPGTAATQPAPAAPKPEVVVSVDHLDIESKPATNPDAIGRSADAAREAIAKLAQNDFNAFVEQAKVDPGFPLEPRRSLRSRSSPRNTRRITSGCALS